MKRFFAFLMAAAMMVGAAACSDDKEGKEEIPDTPSKPNMFQVGEKTYALGVAGCACEVVEYRKVWYTLFLADKAYWDDEGNWVIGDTESAKGSIVKLYLLCADTNYLDTIFSGTYTYLNTPEHLAHNGESAYLILGVSGDWLSIGQANVETSQLEIEINYISGGDSTYEIIFTGGVDEEGNAVSGYYKGKVDMFIGGSLGGNSLIHKLNGYDCLTF